MNPPPDHSQIAWEPADEAGHLMIARLDSIELLQLNRPEVRNALSNALFVTVICGKRETLATFRGSLA